MRSISDFIQEQESGIYSDISLEKAYAECAAALSLAKCYSEQALIMEFAEENGIDSLNIIQESGDDKKENIFKRAGAGIKNVWAKIIKFFKAIYRRIALCITEKRIDAFMEEINKLDKKDTVKSFDERSFSIFDFMNTFKEFIEEYNEWITKTDNSLFDTKKYISDFEDCINEEEWDHDIEDHSGLVIKSTINEKIDRKKIFSTLKEIDKKIKELEKSAKATDKNDQATDADKTKAAAQHKMASDFTKLVNTITRCLDISIKHFNQAWSTMKSFNDRIIKEKD